MVEPFRAYARESRLVALPQVLEPRGNLTALEELVHLPYMIGAVRWYYDMPAGASWPGGEGRLDDALVVALSGSFDVSTITGSREQRVHLSRASVGLHVPAGTEWRGEDAATNSVALVIASGPTRTQPRAPTLDGGVVRAMTASTIDDCSTIAFTRRRAPDGSVAHAAPLEDVPFEIRRVYYLYDVPGGASRGGHAHRGLEQVLIAASGSFEVALTDARRTTAIRVDRAHRGIYVPPGIWRELRHFSSGATCLTLASAPYDEADYIRDLDVFRREKRSASG